MARAKQPTIEPEHCVSTVEQLESLYDVPKPKSLVKEIDHINEHYRRYVELSPFVVVATSGSDGLDCSPRGDPAGFVRVLDEKTVLVPDRAGNNRLDTLRNLVDDPRISLLFLIPGVGETLRINGTAQILTTPELLASFSVRGKVPKSVLRVSVARVYFQCQKALARSRLWDSDAHVPRHALPSAGTILEALSKKNLSEDFDGQTYDKDYPRYMRDTLY